MVEVNKIYNLDCVQGMQLLGDETIDLVVTSPPYDDIRTYKGFVFDFESVAKELFRVLKKGGVIVWVVGDQTKNGSETGTSFKQALYFMELGLNLHDTMIYQKPSASFPEVNRYYQVFEYMFIFSKGKPKSVNLIEDKENKWAGSSSWACATQRKNDGSLQKQKIIKVKDKSVRYNIWTIFNGKGYSSKDNIAYEHPAIFPEQLASDHIISWSNQGDLILDPFMGSGTTAKMARLNNRDFIGFEISEEYCDIANKRIKPYLEQSNIFDFMEDNSCPQ